MDIQKVIHTISHLTDCHVFPPTKLPDIAAHHHPPKDIETLYHLCGGIDLFINTAFPTRIATPDEFVVANTVIFKNSSPEDVAATKDDPSWSWYIVAYGPNSQFITVDLSAERLGAYYNSVWIKHPGNSEIIAYSLSELLLQLLSTRGEYYWFDA